MVRICSLFEKDSPAIHVVLPYLAEASLVDRALYEDSKQPREHHHDLECIGPHHRLHTALENSPANSSGYVYEVRNERQQLHILYP